MTKQVPKSKLISLFGILGYMSALLQWLWLTVLFLPALLNSDLKDFFLPQDASPRIVTPSLQLGGASILWTIIGVAVTVIVLVVTVIVLIRLPKSIASSGHKVANATARAVLPAITHHQKISPKNERIITFRLMKLIKLLIMLIPIIATTGIYFVPESLPTDIAFLVSALLAIGTTVWFSLEYITARFLRIPSENVI